MVRFLQALAVAAVLYFPLFAAEVTPWALLPLLGVGYAVIPPRSRGRLPDWLDDGRRERVEMVDRERDAP